jgi:hypothetical protein
MVFVRWLMRSCCRGFVEEGRKRRVNWVDGKWQDSIIMGILEDEWRERIANNDWPVEELAKPDS